MSSTPTPRRGPALGWRHVVEVAVATVGGLALAIAMSWPLAPRLGADIPGDIGDPLFQAWQVAWIGHALLHQPLHLFQANIFWPLADTLAFSDALVGYAPAGLVAQTGSHSALVVYNLLFLFAYTLAFLGAYLLARELGAGRFGAVAAGAAFAYAPWRLAQNGHLNVLSSGGIPLALFLLLRGYRRKSAPTILAGWLVAAWQITLGFALGLQLGYLLGVLALSGTVVWLLKRPALPPRPVVLATVVGVVVLVVATVGQARPYLRVADHHPEAERKPEDVGSFSPLLAGLLAAPPESRIWGPRTARIRESHALDVEQTLFPGLTVVLLASAGLFSRVYSRRVRLGLALGVVICIALSLGIRDVSGPEKYLFPYRLLYELGPGWNGLRTPGRINTLTSLWLALLAAAGLCLVLRRLRRLAAWSWAPPRAVELTVGLLIVTAILAEGFGPIPHPRVPTPPAGLRLASGPRLELPIASFFGSRYSYWSTNGFPPIANGSGSIKPLAAEQLREATQSFPDARSLAALRRAKVRTVVVHPDLTPGTEWERVPFRPIAGLAVTREVADGVIIFRIAGD